MSLWDSNTPNSPAPTRFTAAESRTTIARLQVVRIGRAEFSRLEKPFENTGNWKRAAWRLSVFTRPIYHGTQGMHTEICPHVSAPPRLLPPAPNLSPKHHP